MRCECCNRKAQIKKSRRGEEYYICEDHAKMEDAEFFRDYENKHKKREVKT